MDKSTILGVILGVTAIGIGMFLKGVSPSAIINPAALLIILAGTAATVLIAFPMSTLKKVPSLLRIIFKEENQSDVQETITTFSIWADKTRKEGLLTLEREAAAIDDNFLASGIQMVIDGQSPEFIKDVLLQKIDAMEERHQKGISIFTQAGTYAPTLGVLGAVVGLIAALGDMEDMEALGHAISAAFIATLLGIFTGYVFWHPFANKLKEKSENEILTKQIIIEGILSLTTGDSPQVIEDKLSSYLSHSELEKLNKGETNATEKTP